MGEKRVGWIYKALGPLFEGVCVYVPKNRVDVEDEKKAPTMVQVEAVGPVNEHWRQGMMISTGRKYKPFVIVNRCFYGITEADMGTKITAKVQIKEKKSPDGRLRYLLVDIIKTSGPRTADLKFSVDGNGPIIPGTTTRINIIDRLPYEERQRQAS